METTDRDLNAGGAELTGDIHGARKLIGLYPDQTDNTFGVLLGLPPNDVLDGDNAVGFVVAIEDHIDVLAQGAAFDQIHRNSVDTRKRIGWDPGLKPLDDVTLVVVVGRFD